MNRIQAFLKRKNVLLSAKCYGVDAMGAMAQGLFASLLIGTIIKTLGQQLGVKVEVLPTAGGDEARALLRSGLHITRRRKSGS